MAKENVIGELGLYYDLAGDVRYTNSKVPIRQLVTPDDPEVREIAEILHQAPDFIIACQDFVHTFTTYAHEPGDYWAQAAETLFLRAGDCDCLAILLCSLLRVYLPATQVYCAVGLWNVQGTNDGHMWVIIDKGGEDQILEATAAPERDLLGNYNLYCIFNDKFAFASEVGLQTFELEPVAVGI